MKSDRAPSALSPRKTAMFGLLSAGFAAGALVALLLAAELAMRFAGVRVPETTVESPTGFLTCDKHPRLGWVFPASARGIFQRGGGARVEATNRWGLRSPAFDESNPGVMRILVLGDSFAFGWGVLESESFPRRLEGLLRARWPSRRIAVVNAAIPGYSLYQQRAMLAWLADSVRFDAVVTTFSLSNDMVDEVRILRFAPDRLVEYSPGPRDPASPLSRVIGRSRALRWLDLRTRSAQFQIQNVLPGSVRRAEDSLDDIVATCRERDVPVLLVLLPRRAEVEGGDVSRRLARWMTRGARRMHARFAERAGTPRADVTPAIASLQAHQSAYLPRDPHWTPAGHDAVAAAILEPVVNLLGAGPPSPAPE